MRKLRVAAFYPHPDDMEAQVGGTLLKYVEQGHEVHVVIAMDGRRGRLHIPERTTWQEVIEIRKREAIAGCSHLGITPVFLGIEDHRLTDDRECYDKVVTAMENLNPDLIFTCAPNDYHNDHRAISRLVLNTAWAPVFFSDTKAGVDFIPDFYVDITSQIDKKITMLSEHVSQVNVENFEMLRILNRMRGIQCNQKTVMYAEAFKLHKRANWVKAYEMLPQDDFQPHIQIVPMLDKN